MSKTCLIIGLGKIGMEYDYNLKNNNKIFSHSKAIFLHKHFKLIGGVDQSKNKRLKFKKKYFLPVFKNAQEAFKKLSPNIIVIATPTNTHYKIFLSVIKIYKPEIIIFEKPLTYNLDKANLIVEKCRKKNISIFVNYFRISESGVIKIKNLLNKFNKFEKFKINAWYSKGLINNGSHLINLFQFLFGKVKLINIIKPARMNNNDFEPDVKIEFKNSSIILRAAKEKNFSLFCFDIISSEFRLFYNDFGNLIELQKISKDKKFSGYQTLSKKKVISNSTDIYQKKVYDQIHKFNIKKNFNLCSGKKALETHKVINIIKRKNNYGSK